MLIMDEEDGKLHEQPHTASPRGATVANGSRSGLFPPLPRSPPHFEDEAAVAAVAAETLADVRMKR